ncbi:MAG: peptidoglycan-binding protein [Ruminococcus sp.]|nr:peptidoglycan-binding protein [Ruminococcus sp.]
MSYTDEQKIEHITELQRYLHGIDMKRGRQPGVIPDGIYGENTKAAVSEFQRDHRLPVTGETDTVTWDEVVKEYLHLRGSEPREFRVFPSADFVSHNGSKGMIVWIIQLIIAELADRYDNIRKVTVNGEYTDDTAESVKQFQVIYGQPCTGDVDLNTWNLLIAVWEQQS